MTNRFDAIVIGAGPAGASAAILLARSGWQIALIEKAAFPRRKVCGECIAASNLPLLDALGIGDAVRERSGAELKRVALMSGEKTLVAPLPMAGDRSAPWGRALGREVLDTLLVEQAVAAGVALWQPSSLQSIGGRPGRFTCSIRSEGGSIDKAGSGPMQGFRAIEAPLVIAAHGSWEPLPFERAQARQSRHPDSLLAFKSNFAGADIAADLLPVLAFAGGYGGMVIADDGLATLACCIREDRLAALRATAPGARAGDVVEHYLGERVDGVARALRGATRQGPWLSTGPIRPGIRLGRRQGGHEGEDGVFRIGNAAGEAHPIVGEGISMALQSAALLAALIAPQRASIVDADRSPAAQRLLRQLHAATWRRHFAQRLRLAALFANVAMRPAAMAAMWPLLRSRPGMLTRGARWSGKTRPALDARTLGRGFA